MKTIYIASLLALLLSCKETETPTPYISDSAKTATNKSWRYVSSNVDSSAIKEVDYTVIVCEYFVQAQNMTIYKFDTFYNNSETDYRRLLKAEFISLDTPLVSPTLPKIFLTCKKSNLKYRFAIND